MNDNYCVIMGGGIGSSWIIIFIYLLLAVALLDVLRLTHLFPLEKFFADSWIGFTALVSLIVLCCTSGYFNYLDKKKVELSLTINKDGGRNTSSKATASSR